MISNLAQGVRAFTSNVFLVDGERTTLVDVGANFDVVAAVEDRVGDLDAVVMTHTHGDHVGNLPDVRASFDVDVWGYDAGNDGIERPIDDGDVVAIGDHEYTALHTPGHKDDHLCFYARDPGILFAGDLVFQNGGFGRTDLEEGDRATLVESIERLLDAVGTVEEMHVGHGPSVSEQPRDHIEMAARMARQY